MPQKESRPSASRLANTRKKTKKKVSLLSRKKFSNKINLYI